MTGTPTCHYVDLPNGRQVHFRAMGSGPPLILLHPSPQDSRAVVPAMEAFADVCSCIALDTPGYGLSDDLDQAQPTLDDYADAVIAAADALAIDRFALYGAATGAQIAIALGKRHPDRVAFAMLDSNGHLDRSQQAEMMHGYFPDVTPRRDGSHLMTWWDMCASVFAAFPWHSDRAEDRLPLPRMPAETVHELLRRYLDAGTSYAKAYQLAFEAEHIDHLRGLAVPATMMRWEGSIVLRLTDAMIAQGLPDNVRVLHAGPSLDERYGVQRRALYEALSPLDLHGEPAYQATASRSGRGYWADLHGHAELDRSGRPVVLLHGAGRSFHQWTDVMASTSRAVIAFDLPGHGHSPHAAASSVQDMAEGVALALTIAGISEADVVGEGLGGAVALELGRHDAALRATLVDPLIVPPERKQQSVAALPDLTPRGSGAHLTEAWHYLRQTATRYPWFDGSPEAALPTDAPPPSALHERVADLVRCADPAEMIRQELRTDWERALREAGDTVSVHFTKHRLAEPSAVELLDSAGVRYSVGALPDALS